MLIRNRGRLMWLLGVVLLAGSVFGTGWALQQPAAGDGPSSPAKSSEGPLGIVGLGYVDIEPGISYLNPLQSGQVAHIYVKEGDDVHAGDLLLSLDNTMARLRLVEAQAAVAAAEHELSDAQLRLPRERQNDIDIQKAQLEVVEAKLAAAERGLKIQRKLYDEKQIVSNDVLAETESNVKAVRAAVKAQQAAVKKAMDFDVQGPINRLRDQLHAKQAVRDQARQAYLECDLYAPADGTVLRIFATVGAPLSVAQKTAAVQFCPNLPRIVRVEILQEWAARIQAGQVALVEDDTRNGVQWKGKVTRISDWYTQRRTPLLEPFQYNDVRTLECIVYLDPSNRHLRLGQRVRVTIRPQ